MYFQSRMTPSRPPRNQLIDQRFQLSTAQMRTVLTAASPATTRDFRSFSPSVIAKTNDVWTAGRKSWKELVNISQSP
jgi:hypothetical protein